VGKAEGMEGMNAGMIMRPVLSMLASVSIGVCGSYALSAVLQPRAGIGGLSSIASTTQQQQQHLARPQLDGSTRSSLLYSRVRQAASAGRLRALALVLAVALVVAAAEGLQAEALLACVTMGLVVANTFVAVPAAQSGAQGKGGSELLTSLLSHFLPAVNVVFFGLAGASLRLSALGGALGAAFGLFVARLGGIWVGCKVGSALGGSAPVVRDWLWRGMVTQAGIALGLSHIVATRFPDWGPDFAALVAAAVAMNLAVGPPMFKAAIVAVGEAGFNADKAAVRQEVATRLER
jgi:hypothetical protein